MISDQEVSNPVDEDGEGFLEKIKFYPSIGATG